MPSIINTFRVSDNSAIALGITLPLPSSAGLILGSTGTTANDIAWVLPSAATGDMDSRLPLAPATPSVFVSTAAGNPHSSTESLGSVGAGDKGAWINGSAGQVLRMNGSATALEFATIAAGTDGIIEDAPAAYRVLVSQSAGRSSTVASGGDNAATWSAQGFQGDSLSVDSMGQVIWKPKQDTLPQTQPGATLQIFTAVGSSGVGTDPASTGFWLPVGLPNQALVVNSTGNNLQWATLPTAYSPPTAPSQNYLLFSDAAGNFTQTLPPSTTNGQILSSTSTGLQWISPSTFSDTNATIADSPAANRVLISVKAGKSHVSGGISNGDDAAQWTSAGFRGDSLSIAVGSGSIEWVPKQNTLPQTNPNATLQLFAALGSSGSGTDSASTGVFLEPGLFGKTQYLTSNTSQNLVWSDPIALPTAPSAENLLVSVAGGVYSRNLAAGSNGDILSIVSGSVQWAPSPSFVDSRIPDSPGSARVLVSSGAGNPHVGLGDNSYWTPAGTSNQSLSIDPITGDVVWKDKQDLLPRINANLGVQIFVGVGQTVPGDPAGNGAWLNPGNLGEALVTGPGASLIWQALPAAYVPPKAPGKANLLFSDTSGNYVSNLSPGAAGELLSVSSTGDLVFVSPSAASDTNSKLPNSPGKNSIFVSTGIGDVHTAASVPSGGANADWLSPGLQSQSLVINSVGDLDWEFRQRTLPQTYAGAGLQLFGAVSNATGTDAADTGVWIPVGSSGQVLTTTATGGLNWTTPSSSVDTNSKVKNAPSAGALFYSLAAGDVHDSSTSTGSVSAGNNGDWLVKGAVGSVLTVTTGSPGLAWQTPAASTDRVIPNAIAAEQLLISTGAGDPNTIASGGGGFSQWLSAGTAGQLLGVTAAGKLAFLSPTAASDTNSKIANTGPINSILVATKANSDPHTTVSGGSDGADWLSPGSLGESLVISASGIDWENRQRPLPLTTTTAGLQIFAGVGPGSAADASNVGVWLDPPSSVGQILTNSATGVRWAAGPTAYVPPKALTANNLLFSNSSGDYLNNLPPGSSSQVLTISPAAGNPLVWATPAPDTDHRIPDTTAIAQILVSNGIGDPSTVASGGAGRSSWLNIGTTVGQVLTVGAGSTLSWTTPTTLPTASSANNLLFSTAAGAYTQSLPPGTGNQVLGMNGTGTALTYRTIVDNDHRIPDVTTANSILIGTKIGDPATTASGGTDASQWLGGATNGQVLNMTATGWGFGTRQNTLPTTIASKAGVQLFAGLATVAGGDDLATVGVFLDPPTGVGQILTINASNIPTWTTPVADVDRRVPDSTAISQLLVSNGIGDIHTVASGGSGRSSWLNIGAANQVLSVNGTATGLIYRTLVDNDHLIPTPTAKNSILISTSATDPHTVLSGGSGGSTWLSGAAAGESLVMNGAGTAFDFENRQRPLPTTIAGQAGVQLFAGLANAAGGDDLSTVGVFLNAPTAVGQILRVNASNIPEFVTPAADRDHVLPPAANNKQILISTAAGDPHSATLSSGTGVGANNPAAGGNATWENENDFLIRNLDGIAADSAVTKFVDPTVPVRSNIPGAIIGFENSGFRVPQIFKRENQTLAFHQFKLPPITASEQRNNNVNLAAGTRHNIVGLLNSYTTDGYGRGTTPAVFTDTQINIPVAGVWQITFGATIGAQFDQNSLLVNPSTGVTMTAAAARTFHQRSCYYPTLSFAVNDGILPTYEIRGTQTLTYLREDHVFYNLHDVSVITTASVYFQAAGFIIPRMHWFSAFQCDVARLNMSINRSNAHYCSIQQLPDVFSYYTTY